MWLWHNLRRCRCHIVGLGLWACKSQVLAFVWKREITGEPLILGSRILAPDWREIMWVYCISRNWLIFFPHSQSLFFCPKRFLGILWRTQRRNGLKCVMLMYPNHHQKWWNFGHGLLIFLHLAQFWLCEMGQIWLNRYESRYEHFDR